MLPSGPRSSVRTVSEDWLRRGVAEFVGTFTLIFAGVGAIALGADLTGVALAHGLAIAVMVSAVGHISGGHFNPAITFGFWVTRRIEAKSAAAYWLEQFAGATAPVLRFNCPIPRDVLLHGAATVTVISPVEATVLAA